MAGRATILGVHSVTADEPVHLIELLIEGAIDEFEIGQVTQEDPTQPVDNWQVAYDERLSTQSDGVACCTFFFHYLDFTKPLLSSFGPLRLPDPTATPDHLKTVTYEPP